MRSAAAALWGRLAAPRAILGALPDDDEMQRQGEDANARADDNQPEQPVKRRTKEK